MLKRGKPVRNNMDRSFVGWSSRRVRGCALLLACGTALTLGVSAFSANSALSFGVAEG
jgi:hypothetical protein